MILVTGGAGFIGANFVLDWADAVNEPVVNLDKLTYPGNLENLRPLQGDARHVLQGDIGNRTVINFAAESLVDRSIHGPAEFVQTFESGIRKTVAWYPANQGWVAYVTGEYRNRVSENYTARQA